MLTRTSRYLLAAIQAIIGWEWIMSGGNKLFSGTFPQGLADALISSFKDNPNGLYVAYCIAVVVAAAIGAFQNINFHFFMGGWVLPSFDPGSAYNEGIDLDGLLPLFFLVIIIANLAMVQALTGIKFFKRKAQAQSPTSTQVVSNS